jgi:hypothetical protein
VRIHDQCGVFLGYAFTTTIEVSNGVKLMVPNSTVKNPQANTICERVHQTIGNTLLHTSMLLVNPPNSTLDGDELIGSVLATTMHTARESSNHSLVNNSPGAPAFFHRNMMLDIPLLVELIIFRYSRQAIVYEM